ncbi:MAG TPA: hypothetical protein VFV77_08960 [Gammaproteobacteria bacterium]|nr:hypothetical protein [Gammaproteobacteria bacterium]
MRIASEDRMFLERFTACETPKEGFRHADHVRLAWLLLAEAPLLPALLHFRSLLKAFAAHHDATELYNETITCFYMLLIAEAMQAMDPDHGWEEFRTTQSGLLGYPKALLEHYYPGGLAFSPAARGSFLLPEGVPRAA